MFSYQHAVSVCASVSLEPADQFSETWCERYTTEGYQNIPLF